MHCTKSLRDSPLCGKVGSESSGVGNQSSEQTYRSQSRALSIEVSETSLKGKLPMTTPAIIPPLRQRMIEDMVARNLGVALPRDNQGENSVRGRDGHC